MIPVIRGEPDDGVGEEVQAAEGGDQLAHCPVQLAQGIAEHPTSAPPVVLLRRELWVMNLHTDCRHLERRDFIVRLFLFLTVGTEREGCLWLG